MKLNILPFSVHQSFSPGVTVFLKLFFALRHTFDVYGTVQMIQLKSPPFSRVIAPID